MSFLDKWLPDDEGVTTSKPSEPKKEASPKKSWFGWNRKSILFSLIFIFAMTGIRMYYTDQRLTNQAAQRQIVADQVSIPSFVRYSDQAAGFDFSVLFPTSDPEFADLDMGIVRVISYRAPHFIDLDQQKFAQYAVSISPIKEGGFLVAIR